MMRWKEKIYHMDEVRIREGFLFFPKRIREDVRWLEYARWEERFYGAYLGWDGTRWIDDPDN
jgi:hypothetical protein